VLARRLLSEAGFPGGQGFPAVTLVGPDNRFTDLNYRWLSEQWEQHLGVSIKYRLLSLSENLTATRGGDNRPHLWPINWVADYPDPDNFLRVAWLAYQTPGQNEAYLQLVERARTVPKQTQRLALYRQADQMLVENAYLVPVYHMRQVSLLKPWVRQYPVSPMNVCYWKDVIIEPH
jgi:oligopeptide transport system substrate-binding protein